MLVIDPHWVMGAALLSLRLSAVWMLTPLMTLFQAPMLFSKQLGQPSPLRQRLQPFAKVAP